MLGLQESHSSQGQEWGQGQAGAQAISASAPSTEPQPSEASALADLPGSECDQGLGGERNDGGLFAIQHIFSPKVE